MNKPLGHKNYGHIPHLPGSRMGPGDHKCHEGQERICLEKPRDKHDRIIVTEKLDGSNVGVARVGGKIIALGRAGYLASTSKWEQHQLFADWVRKREDRFDCIEEGERLVGEWMAQAHGTRYRLTGEPFVAFDLIKGQKRATNDAFLCATRWGDFTTPHVVHFADAPCSISKAMAELHPYGFHGGMDFVEGAVWRVERNELIDKKKGGARAWRVDFLAKYVRPDKEDGTYLPEVSGKDAVWNWRPNARAANR
jgi:hypothetical protein